jgi:two-component system, NarL family, invasion response regulator UvrY
MMVMIVDDSALLQSRLSKALLEADKNISITQALSCKEATEKFAALKPDVVILDIALPDGSGINLLKQFKKVSPGAKVIMFTNYPTAEFKARCEQLGADYFLDKSKISDLIKIIV